MVTIVPPSPDDSGTPHRIQLRRTEGWRKPEGAVVVARPTRWGNPFLIGDVYRRFPSLTLEQAAGFAVNEFRDLMHSRGLRARHRYPAPAVIRRELAGRDLACWCALEDPCHADVLLEIANGPAE